MALEGLLKTVVESHAAGEAEQIAEEGVKLAVEFGENSEVDEISELALALGAPEVEGGAEVATLGVEAGILAAKEVESVAAPFCTRLYNNLLAKFAPSRVTANLKFLSMNSIFTACANLWGSSAGTEPDSNDVFQAEVEALEDSSEFVTVGDPNNLPDPQTGLGAASEVFQIGIYDVTVAEWAFFLTAVQATDNDGRHLYHPQEFTGEITSYNFLQAFEDQGRVTYVCDDKNTIFYTDSDGSSAYYQSTRFPSRATFPITGISCDDGKRYCNWRHHGRPVIDKLDEETILITETGAYDFTNGQGGVLCVGATYFLPTLNEWYKAAYYKGGGINAGYWRYPLQADSLPFQGSIDALLKPGAVRKGANFATITYGWFYNTTTYYTQETPGLTTVGFFKDSPAPCGAYDLGGNVRQWTSDLVSTKQGDQAIVPGGCWSETSDALLNTQAKSASSNLTGSPTIGLRICASVDQALQNSGEANQQYADKAGALQSDQQQEYSRVETFCGLLALGAFSEAVAFFGLEVPDAMNGSEKQTWEQILARWDFSRWAINVIYVSGTSWLNAARDVPLHE
jgi:formylglycine-generating enzyme required for sulfatase activity